MKHIAFYPTLRKERSSMLELGTLVKLVEEVEDLDVVVEWVALICPRCSAKCSLEVGCRAEWVVWVEEVRQDLLLNLVELDEDINSSRMILVYDIRAK